MATDYEERRETERRVELTEQQRVTALAHALAEELTKTTGDQWKVTKYPGMADTRHSDAEGATYSYGEVTASDGAAFILHGAGWAGRGRISIGGDFPRDERNAIYGPRYDTAEYKACRATIAADRAQGDTLAATARGIVRRILPAYRDQYAQAIAAKRTSDEHNNAAAELARQMRAALHDDRDYSRSTPDDHGFYINLTGHTYGSGRTGDDYVTFDRLTTNAGKALRIAAILAEREEGDK